MYSDTQELAGASKSVVRAHRHEWELSYEVLDAVFKAKETAHLQILLDERVYENPIYEKLPKFRQIALQAYFRGVCDALARVAGVKVPHVQPKSIPPKKVRKTRVKKPNLYPTPLNPIRTPVPEWLNRPETILPPPELQSHG